MSLSKQDIENRIATYYSELDSVVTDICARLHASLAEAEQKYEQDCTDLAETQKAKFDRIEKVYKAEIDQATQKFQDTKDKFADYVNRPAVSKKLRKTLAEFYRESPSYKHVINDVGLEEISIRLNQSAIDDWAEILIAAYRNNKVYEIIEYVFEDYPTIEKKIGDDSLSSLYQNCLEQKRAFCDTENKQKSILQINIDHVNQQSEELRVALVKNVNDKKKEILTELNIGSKLRKWWQNQLQGVIHDSIEVTEESNVVDSLPEEGYIFNNFGKALLASAHSSIKALHKQLLLAYIIYRLLQKDSGDDLLEKLEFTSISLDMFGGTLHSRLLHDPALDHLRLQLEEQLHAPYITARYKLPVDSDGDNSVITCAIGLDGNWLVAAYKDKTLRLWDTTTGLMEGKPFVHNKQIYDCDIDYTGINAITASADGLRLWHLISGMEYESIDSPSMIPCCSISPDGTQIVWGNGRWLKGWLRTSQTQIETDIEYGIAKLYQYSGQTIQKCTWNPNGKQVAAVAANEIIIWEVEDAAVHNHSFHHGSGYISCCAWHPAGNALVFGSVDNTLKVWETTTNKIQHILVGHTGPVRGCGWSKSGEWIVSVSDDKTLKVWDANTGDCVSTFYADGQLTCCAIHADPQLVIAGGHKGIYWLKFNYHSRKDIQHV